MKGFVSSANIGKPAPKNLTLFTRKFTLRKGLMNAANVENLLPINPVVLHIKEFTLEKGLMSAVNVGNLLLIGHPSLII